MSSCSALYHVMGPILILQLSWVCLCSGYIPGLHIRLDLGRAPADGNSNHFRALWEIAVSIFPLTQKYSCFFFFLTNFFTSPLFSYATNQNLLHALVLQSPGLLNTVHFFCSQKDPNRFDRDRLFSAVSRGSPEALDGLLEYLRRTSKFLTNSEYTGRLLLSTSQTGLAEAMLVNIVQGSAISCIFPKAFASAAD